MRSGIPAGLVIRTRLPDCRPSGQTGMCSPSTPRLDGQGRRDRCGGHCTWRRSGTDPGEGNRDLSALEEGKPTGHSIEERMARRRRRGTPQRPPPERHLPSRTTARVEPSHVPYQSHPSTQRGRFKFGHYHHARRAGDDARRSGDRSRPPAKGSRCSVTQARRAKALAGRASALFGGASAVARLARALASRARALTGPTTTLARGARALTGRATTLARGPKALTVWATTLAGRAKALAVRASASTHAA